MKLKDVDNSVIDTREQEILKLQVLVMAYHNIFQGMVERVLEDELQEEFCSLCYFGTPCGHVDNPSEDCIYNKLMDAGNNWDMQDYEEIKEQIIKSQKALFCFNDYLLPPKKKL